MHFLMFDAVAIVLSESAAKRLMSESAAIDFIRDAFGHLKALMLDQGGQILLQAAGVRPDVGVLAINDIAGFVAAAKTRQWDREKFVRTLA